MLTRELVLIAIFCNPVANFYIAYKLFEGINLSRVFLEELFQLILGVIFSISGFVSLYVVYLMIWGYFNFFN